VIQQRSFRKWLNFITFFASSSHSELEIGRFPAPATGNW